MTTPVPSKDLQVLVSTVGKSHEPIVFSIETMRPAHVWYIASRGTLDTIAKVQESLSAPPAHTETIVLENGENLTACYAELLREIPRLMEKHRVDPSNVLLDYTGGTKTMSAAAVLAAAEFIPGFVYVSGERRNGRGTVESGSEYHVNAANPWDAFAVRARNRVQALFGLGEFEACAIELEERTRQSTIPHTLKGYSDLLRGYAALDRFDIDQARARVGAAMRTLAPHWETSGAAATAQNVSALFARMRQWPSNPQEGANDIMVRELLSAARRRCRSRHFDDACARLYRAIEMSCQVRLYELSDGTIHLGRTAPKNLVDAGLRRAKTEAAGHSGEAEARLALEDCLHELAARGDERAGRFVEDLRRGVKSEFRTATQARNNSILAHGSVPMSSEDFDRLWTIAARLIGFADEDIPELPDPGFFF